MLYFYIMNNIIYLGHAPRPRAPGARGSPAQLRMPTADTIETVRPKLKRRSKLP